MIERENLLAALTLVKPALAKDDVIEAYTHVWFDKETVTASNGEGLGIRATFKSDVTGGIPGGLLIGLLSNSKAKEVEIEGEEKDPNGETLVLKAGKTRATFSYLPPDAMLANIPNEKKAKTFAISKAFLEAVEKVLPGVGHPKAKMPEQTGVTILKRAALQVLATDGNTITWAVCKDTNWPLKDGEQITLPIEFVEQMLIAGKKDELAMSLGKESVFIKSKRVLVFSPLVDVSEPTDLIKVVNEANKGAAYSPIPARLKLALARAFVMLDKQKEEYITISVAKNVLKIKVVTALGELIDRMALEGEAKDVETILDPKLIKRGLAFCERMFVGNKHTLLSGKDFTYMIASFQ